MNPVNARNKQIKRMRCRPARIGFWLMWTACVFIVSAPAVSQDQGYRKVDGPCNLQFPEDHGDHPGYRTEWWYYTGNLTADGGRRFGFQLTLFRRQISPPDSDLRWPRPASRWRTQQLYLGHAALTDLQEGRHLFGEDIAREALTLSGVRREDDRIHVFLKDWQIEITPRVHRLRAATGRFAFELFLEPRKPPVLHGEKGYSRKGSQADMASCYYSFTRMAARGSVGLGDAEFAVRGRAWMDHEFSTAPLEPGLEGWDWFSLQLDNATELMLFRLRRAAGGIHPASSGTLVFADGTTRAVTRDDFEVEVLERWKSPASGAQYPVKWRLTLPPLGLDLQVDANLADQEMRTTESTGVTYWEGSVAISGTYAGQAVQGLGYVELSGYAEPFDRPL